MSWWLAWVAAAWAGDPCPIEVRFHAYSPPWRDVPADLAALKTQVQRLGLAFRDDGTVDLIVPGGPASLLDVQVNDRIVAVDGQAVADGAAVLAAMDRSQGEVVLSVQRHGAEQPLSVTLRRAPVDPVLDGLINVARRAECGQAMAPALSEAQRSAIATGAFDAQQGFRCQDAHTALAGAFSSGDLLFVRGGRRLLITMPGWNTHCVDVASYDGDGLQPEALERLFRRVTAAYTKDRHDNP